MSINAYCHQRFFVDRRQAFDNVVNGLWWKKDSWQVKNTTADVFDGDVELSQGFSHGWQMLFVFFFS